MERQAGALGQPHGGLSPAPGDLASPPEPNPRSAFLEFEHPLEGLQRQACPKTSHVSALPGSYQTEV